MNKNLIVLITLILFYSCSTKIQEKTDNPIIEQFLTTNTEIIQDNFLTSRDNQTQVLINIGEKYNVFQYQKDNNTTVSVIDSNSVLTIDSISPNRFIVSIIKNDSNFVNFLDCIKN